eukprot:1700143-Ditylum_brightwellii.AAC.1
MPQIEGTERDRVNKIKERRQRRRKSRPRNNKLSITFAICALMTAHVAITNMPDLIDGISSDKDDYFTHQQESNFDSIDGDDLDNRKMLTQPPRNENENENLIKIGNGSSDLKSDDDNRSFLIQDAIEHSLVQSLQEDDHIMPFDDKNGTSVDPLPRNDYKNTINKCFKKGVSCCKHHFMNMLS